MTVRMGLSPILVIGDPSCARRRGFTQHPRHKRCQGRYALTEAMDEGHCGLPEEELGPLAARLLEVPDDLIRTALDLELAEGMVVADTVEDTACVFLGGLHRAERAIARRGFWGSRPASSPSG